MSKKTKNRVHSAATSGPNPRQPCPCGSGKRYKACHGAGEDVIVPRPFQGMAAECDLVALREFVPSGVASLPLAPAALQLAGGRTVRLGTVLPGAAAALVRPNGDAFVGVQVQTRGGDLAVDLGRALRWALTAEPGEVLAVAGPALGDPVRLHDLVTVDIPLDVTVYRDFAWWLPEDGEPTAEVTAALERANKAIKPTEIVRGEGVRAAYWVDAGAKAHLRWVRPEPEDRLLAALARLAAADQLDLGEGSRYVGSFRAHGLLVPVWDLDRDMHAKEWTGPAEAFAARLDEALASLRREPLTEAERRARESLTGRQVTLR
jgi:hypothetical protein